MAYKLTHKAEDDIVALYVEGVRLFGIAQAEKYHAELETAFRFLADNPEAARERQEISPPVRIHPCGSHVIVYLIESSGDILVVRVRHGHEDWTSNPR